MSEFVGRTGAQRLYSYPENRRAAALGLFARNFATGPKISTEAGEDVLLPWNLIDALSITFTVAAGGITVSIPGDVTTAFTNGDAVEIIPTAPSAGPAVTRTVSSVPAFALGFTTFDLDSPIDLVTTAGVIGSFTNVPITPRVTGVVRILGVVTFGNGSGSPSDGAEIEILVNGVSVGEFNVAPLADDQIAEVTFLAQVTLPVGVTANVSIIVQSDGFPDILAGSSAIELQEVAVSTG